MPKTTFFATDPDGVTHKRTSQGRAYTHTVVFKEGAAYLERAAPDLDKFAKDAGRRYDVLVLQSQGIHEKADLWRGEKALKFFQDFAIKHLSDGRTRESMITESVEDAKKWYASRVASGHHLVYDNAGWCGRRDLAEKLAATLQGRGYEDIRILEAKVEA